MHYEKGNDSFFSSSDKNPNDGVIQSAFVTNEKSNDTRPRGYAIWGMKGLGGSENWGRKGVVEGSMSFTDLVIPTGGGAPLLNPLVNFVRYMIGLTSNVNNVKDAITPNKSTMENKVEEEMKNVPVSVKVTIEIKVPTSIGLPIGSNGLRIGSVIKDTSVIPQDTARIKELYRAKFDSIRKSYKK